MKNIYKVFVASSLKLDEYRDAVEETISNVNEMVKEMDLSFLPFLYEKKEYSNIMQKLEKNDAQEPIDWNLRQSALFFLITIVR